MSHWFLFGALRLDQPVSAVLAAELLASGSLTAAELAELREAFERRVAKQDAGASAAVALLVLQGTTATQYIKQALTDLLNAERLAPEQRQDLPRAVLRANLVRALTPQDALDIQAVANDTKLGRAASPQPSAAAWSPNLSGLNLQSETGQLKLFELAFQQLDQKWPAVTEASDA